jgi:hypothetical protein
MSNTFKTISNDELVTATGGLYGGLGLGLGHHPIAALNNQLATLNANNNCNNNQTTNTMMLGMCMAMANRPRY